MIETPLTVICCVIAFIILAILFSGACGGIPDRVPKRPPKPRSVKLSRTKKGTDGMINTEQLSANGGHWQQTGTSLYRLPKFIYAKPLLPGNWIHWKLGTIKLRNDGRWGWWRHKSPYFLTWRAGQGVALTKAGAISMVHSGWHDTDIESAPMADMYEYTKITSGWRANEVLGRVIDTHTGVWTWIRHKSKLYPEWKPDRGTSRSCRLAHQNLMDGWE